MSALVVQTLVVTSRLPGMSSCWPAPAVEAAPAAAGTAKIDIGTARTASEAASGVRRLPTRTRRAFMFLLVARRPVTRRSSAAPSPAYLTDVAQPGQATGRHFAFCSHLGYLPGFPYGHYETGPQRCQLPQVEHVGDAAPGGDG